MSLMLVTSRPEAWSARIAVSRPLPGPRTNTSIFRMPLSWAMREALSAATCAANGVPFREPLKFALPALAQLTVLPLGSVIVISVLLKVARMWAVPWGTTFLSFALPFVVCFLAMSVLGLVARGSWLQGSEKSESPKPRA